MSEDADLDVCVYCGTSGCLDGTAEHATDCPFSTGVYIVNEADLTACGCLCSKCAVQMACGICSIEINLGEAYTTIPDVDIDISDEPIALLVCLGCAVLHGTQS